MPAGRHHSRSAAPARATIGVSAPRPRPQCRYGRGQGSVRSTDRSRGRAPMKVLVSAASRTAQASRSPRRSARPRRRRLRDRRPVARRRDEPRYGDVILGSSVYVGHRMDAAASWSVSKEITAVPWLFSSGPMGHEPKPYDEPRTSPSWSRHSAREHWPGGRQEPARPRREGPPDRGPGARGRLPALGRDPGVGLRDRGRAQGGLATIHRALATMRR
jgi:hypothetical protein